MQSHKAIVAGTVVAVVSTFVVPRLWTGSSLVHDTLFDPNQTDVLGYVGMKFADESSEHEQGALGMYFELTWWKALQIFLYPEKTEDFNFEGDGDNRSAAVKSIDILDARIRQDEVSFDKTGIMLMNLRDYGDFEEPENWDLDQIQTFHETVLEERLRHLFPSATRIETFAHHIRGRRIGPPAAVGTTHSDFSLNMEKNDLFLQEYGQSNSDGRGPMYQALHDVEAYKKNRTAYKETHEDVLVAVLSLWKPIEMPTPVCDKPMVFMDASTYHPEDERDYEFHFYMWPFFTDHVFNTLPVYRPEYQKWYYYPFMTNDEAVIFYQHDARKDFFRVPHAAFNNPNCPPGTAPRHSMDYRFMIFEKDL